MDVMLNYGTITLETPILFVKRCIGRLLHTCQRDNGNYAPQRAAIDRRLRQPEGGIMQPEGGIMFPEGLHDFHWPEGRAQ